MSLESEDNVSKDLKDEFARILNTYKYKYYGDENKQITGLCKRINFKSDNKQKLHSIFGNQWQLVEMVWIINNDSLPDNNLELSHICGKPKKNSNTLCINPKHIMQQKHWENINRKACHNDIRRFEKKINRYKTGQDKIVVPGPIFASNISETDQNILTTTPNIRYNKSKKQSRKERKMRTRFKAKSGGKRYKAPKIKENPFRCDHITPCFINFGSTTSESPIVMKRNKRIKRNKNHN